LRTGVEYHQITGTKAHRLPAIGSDGHAALQQQGKAAIPSSLIEGQQLPSVLPGAVSARQALHQASSHPLDA